MVRERETEIDRETERERERERERVILTVLSIACLGSTKSCFFR